MSQQVQSVEAARQAHKWLVNSELYRNIIDQAGGYDSKIHPSENTSLATHIINAVTVAVNSFVYESFSPEESISEYEEDIRVLAAATALHDTNKFVREAYGFDADGNTRQAFDVYFGEHDELDIDGDAFGIESNFLGNGYREDLLYLVQRCEIGEDSTETRRTDTDFRGLERYSRIGDQVASIAQREDIHAVGKKLQQKFDSDDVHLLEFTTIEQPVLNNLLIGAVKQAILGRESGNTHGVTIGSSRDAVVYLGDEISRSELKSRVADIIVQRVSEFGFSCKLTWNSFDYDVLSEISIPVESKKQIIAEEFRQLLNDGTAGVEAFQQIPEAFDQYFPPLAKAMYLDRKDDFADPEVQDAYDRIYDEQGGQKVKIHFIAYLIKNYTDHAEFLREFSDEIRPDLHSDLEAEIDVIDIAIDRFFESQDIRSLGSKGSMCFLCGKDAESKYQKGLSGVYRTQEYSRRLPPHEKYKSICAVCNLEYALFSDICDRSEVSTNLSIEVAYFYFDEFLGDIQLYRGRRMGNIIQDETIDIDDPEITTSLLDPQYFLQPFFVLNDNHRMSVIRQIMRTARQSGMKVVIGRAFTRFDASDAVFIDQQPTRVQELLGLDEVERLGPLPGFIDDTTDSHLERSLSLFNLISMIGREAGLPNPYLELDRDTFHSIVNFAVVNHDRATVLSELQQYLEAYHSDTLMKMKTIAERGLDLFGKQYDSKYKKTKIFRTALDAFLSGKSQNMADEQVLSYVESQVYVAADREDYAGQVTTEQAEAFVESIQSYLVTNDLDDLKKLSDWEDALVNSYYYAYDQLLYDN
jgi:CRISPR-associated protein Csc3